MPYGTDPGFVVLGIITSKIYALLQTPKQRVEAAKGDILPIQNLLATGRSCPDRSTDAQVIAFEVVLTSLPGCFEAVKHCC